jgi:hypothetical protein
MEAKNWRAAGLDRINTESATVFDDIHLNTAKPMQIVVDSRALKG